MMTESEAKTKWCPFARMLAHTYAQDGKGRIFEGGYSYNRSPDDDECYIPTGAKCLASGCMAWRWDADFVYFRRLYCDTKEAVTEPPRPANVPASWEWVPYDPDEEVYTANWVEPETDRAARRKGYCGLAGVQP